MVVDDSGRNRAENVTGPMGAYVQGAPRRPRIEHDSGFGRSDNYGSSSGGGFGGSDHGSGDRY